MSMSTAPHPLLADYASLPPLSNVPAEGKKELSQPLNASLSPAYDVAPSPIDSSNNCFDFHIYFHRANEEHFAYAKALHERIRREFPELRVYKIFEQPVGPHMMPMFEVNVFTPHQLGTLLAWLVVNRGPCSVLIHPNTGSDVEDHSTSATWLGEKVPLDIGMLRKFQAMSEARRQAAATAAL